MELGAFSISLPVTDLARSRAFYETLGFTCLMDTSAEGFLIMKNGTTVIGLFHNMFQAPMLTFNPGWDQSAQTVDPFTDVRALKTALRDAGIEITAETGGEAGPGSFTVVDPDGHPILVDQHR